MMTRNLRMPSIWCAGRQFASRLFRLDARVAAGRAGRRDHLEGTAFRRRLAYLRIDAGGWADHAFRLRELIAQRPLLLLADRWRVRAGPGRTRRTRMIRTLRHG